MLIYGLLFMFVCFLAFVLTCLAEMYSEKGKEKVSAKVKTETDLKTISVNTSMCQRKCNYEKNRSQLKKAG